MTVHHQPPRALSTTRPAPVAPRVKVKPVTGTKPTARPFGADGKRVKK
jgi:hypothetical protein